jgi:hypothetical protein
MMATAILIGVVLVAVLVMLSGVWVATVLIATITHVKQPAPSAREQVVENPRP